jgi:PAS domain S-box-containing protein
MTDSLRGASGVGAVLERVGDAVAVVDDQGVLRRANGQFEALYGVDGAAPESLIDQLRVGDVGPATVDRFEERLSAVLSRESDEAVVMTTGAGTNGDRPTRCRIEPIHGEADGNSRDDGRVVGATLVASPDPTTGESDGTAAFERVTDGVFAVDGEWSITHWNDRMCELTGSDAAAVVDDHLWEAVPVVVGTELESQLREAMAAGESRTVEVYLDSPVAEWIEARVYPGEDGLSVLARAITDRRYNRRELRETKRTFEAIVESVADAVVMIDGDRRVTFWNTAAEDLFGWSETAVLGERIPFVPEERLEELDEILQTLDAGETVRARETVREDKAGNQLDVSVSMARVDVGGELVGYVGTYADIARRKEYENSLEERTKKLELLNRILRHDVRNDMTVVLAQLDLLAEHVDDAGEDRLRSVRERSEHVVGLTDVLRDLLRVLLDDDPSLQRTSLSKILEDEIDDVSTSFDGVVTRIDGPLPQVSVEANEMLGSVFRNVLKNAVQHNDADVPTVTVTVEEGADTVLVRIADNGPGIPDGRKEEVFGRGEKGLESSGTGIGLYLVDTLMTEFDGDVWVEDADAGGACVCLEFPVVEWGNR